MSNKSVRDVFLEDFETLRTTIESALAEPSQDKILGLLEIVLERHGSQDAAGLLRLGFGLGVMETLQHFDVGEELIDGVLEKARGELN